MNNSLPEAASRMKIEKFRDFLDVAMDLEERDSKGRTALFRAARLGRTEHMALLIRRGADVNATDDSGEAPLQATARYGHIECAELLVNAGAILDHCPPPETTDYSESALCSAVRKAPQLVKFLLSRRADPNAASAARRLPLIIAAEDKKNIEIVRMLIDVGARVNEQDHRGRTALHAAIDAGSVPMIELLLAHGADTEVEAEHWGTALCAAIMSYGNKRAPLVTAVLAARPNLAAVCPSWDMTPIELAIEFKLRDVVGILKQAGSPPPRNKEDRGESDDDDDDDDDDEDIADDGGQGLSDEEGDDLDDEGLYVVPYEHPPIPTRSDKELADEIFRSGPSLCERFGWRVSPGHCTALQKCTYKPIPIERVAYFVRGYFNKPKGKELDDGPELLGESYLSAMTRFVNEGLVEFADQANSMELTYDSNKLKAVAKCHNIKISGSKMELIRRLHGCPVVTKTNSIG